MDYQGIYEDLLRMERRADTEADQQIARAFFGDRRD